MSPRHCFKHTVSVNILSQEVVLLLTGEEVRPGAVQELAQKCWDNTSLSDPSAAEDGLPETTACRSEMRPQTSLKPRTVLMCLPSGRMEKSARQWAISLIGHLETSCFFCYLHFHVF